MECGIFCARCPTSCYCVNWMSRSSVLRPCSCQTPSLFWNRQLPTNKTQVWFFRWRFSLQVLLLVATFLHFSPGLGHLWPFGLSLCAHAPCSPGRCCYASSIGLCFHPSPCWARCAWSSCCSCLSCFSSRPPSSSFSSKVQRGGLCKHILTSVHEFVSLIAQEIRTLYFFQTQEWKS